MREEPARAILLDVDGTLVDTNWLHAIAWQRAFRSAAGLDVPAYRVHHQIGKGGDQLVAAVAGDDVERGCGDAVRDAHAAAYGELIDEVRPLPGARDLVVALKERGVAVVLASSAQADEVDRYLDLLELRDVVDGWTTSADVDHTKPSPDVIDAALAQVEERPALLVGDSVWDCEAARNAGIPVVALRTGGFCAGELRAAGARTLYESPAELLADLDGAGVAALSR